MIVNGTSGYQSVRLQYSHMIACSCNLHFPTCAIKAVRLPRIAAKDR